MVIYYSYTQGWGLTDRSRLIGRQAGSEDFSIINAKFWTTGVHHLPYSMS